MGPNAQALTEALSKLGLEALPFAKMFAIAWFVGQCVVGLIFLVVAYFILRDFLKMRKDFDKF